ncbi:MULTISPECIES: hypothetical protein [Pseudomonas syringae group]|uniref:hypothetical protein n=1 Tax=Pseudomonas syringae group TaxID=136849 RepID=UPI00070FB8D5|nr:hypothetical protein [Pseudomonas syringae group genomosp. 3]
MTFSIIVLFKCDSCARVTRSPVQPSEISWSYDASIRDTLIECENCATSYNATVKKLPYRFEVVLVDHPTIEVFSSVLTKIFEPDNSHPNRKTFKGTDDPLFEFLSSYSHMTEVLHTYGVGSSALLKSSAPEINKLVLSGLVSAMEAYLANTLITLVAEEIDATENLLRKEEILSSQKITLFEAWSENSSVERRVQDYLRDQIYHRLGKVEKLYEIAFNIQIFPGLEIKTRLHRTVSLRHDIVHRNGRSVLGEEQDFSSDTVQAMMRDIYDFVMHVNNELFKSIM